MAAVTEAPGSSGRRVRAALPAVPGVHVVSTNDGRVTAKLEQLGGEATRWWASLDAPTREELVGRWVAIPLAGSAARSVEVRGAAGRIAVDDVDGPQDRGGWNRDLYEFAVAHDVVFHLNQRVFHICRAHDAARRVAREGRILAGFRCPFARSGCPMRALVDAAGGDVGLRFEGVGADGEPGLRQGEAVIRKGRRRFYTEAHAVAGLRRGAAGGRGPGTEASWSSALVTAPPGRPTGRSTA